MKKQNANDLIRLRQLILTDNINIPNSSFEVLKSDTKAFFRNHFKLEDGSFNMELTVTDNGNYDVQLSFIAKDMYDIKVIQ